MDETDRKILRTLQKHPALTVVELAQKVRLSHTPCWRRLKKMEEDGIIQRRNIVLDQNALGLSVNVFAHVRLKQHDEETLEAFEQKAQSLPEILECFSMSGESDYLFRIVAASIEDYERFLKKVLLHLPGVAAVNSSFALKSVKVTTDLPI